MVTFNKEEFKHNFEAKMYSLYAQPIKEASNCSLLASFIG